MTRRVLLLAVVVAALWGLAPTERALRVATFNIENFPKDARQVQGAMALIASLQLSAVALQEITDPARLERAARASLGDDWRFAVPPDHQTPAHRVGVLYDGGRFELLELVVDEGPRLGGRHKPALMTRLRERRSGEVWRIVSVHLKSGGEHAETRARQLDRLRDLVDARGDEQLVLMGDFNATSEEDRDNIAALARGSGLSWATAGLKCTSYWNRRDGCLGTPLDHALSTVTPRAVVAAGACARVGCDKRPACPIEHAQISDHCPVVLDLTK